jgi:hypothetical protein
LRSSKDKQKSFGKRYSSETDSVDKSWDTPTLSRTDEDTISYDRERVPVGEGNDAEEGILLSYSLNCH